MFDIESINIKEGVLHVLDTEAPMPVISTECLELTPEMLVFLSKHLDKQLNSVGLKEATFKEDSEFKKLMSYFEPANFLSTTQNIAQVTFDFMKAQGDIPSSDNVYLQGDIDGRPFFCMMKYDYKVSYCHQIFQEEEKVSNQIIRHVRTIANEGQKSDAFYLIFLDNYEVKVVEKLRLIDGKKEAYLSSVILQVGPQMAEGKKQEVLDKACKQIIEDRYNGNPVKYAQIKQQMLESIDLESSSLNVEDFVASAPLTPEERKHLAQELDEQGLTDAIAVNKSIERKIVKKQKIMTDLGVEIILPEDFLQRQELFEFKNNEDGTINLTIKSIKHLQTK